MPIENKNIVITGAASGIGRALLFQLTSQGNKILAIDINEVGLVSLKKLFPQISTLKVDLTESKNLSLVFQEIKSQMGVVDIFFANAGIAKYGLWEDIKTNDIDKIFKINTLIPIETAHWLKENQKNHPFRLVVTASAISYWPVPGYAAYAASKAAIHQFAETLRSEGDGSWLTLAYPSATDTGFFDFAGKDIPKAFPVQSADSVARAIVKGVEKGKTRIYPSTAFWLVMKLNKWVPILQPIYFFIESQKLHKWSEGLKNESQ
ncbi:SDR family NAD(P)-dependent oxidoreductase [Shivajiella indica]|uniref:SDR family NAD(P)-dependent oxidoreductase n=1 Tax=Shivajiella indica TaxID=872115 RepID=A0ABW5B359_9BACT